MDEDKEYEARQMLHEMREMRRNRNRHSCADGYCGAEDCSTCRPNSREYYNEEEEGE